MKTGTYPGRQQGNGGDGDQRRKEPSETGGQSGRWGVVAEIGAGEGGSVWVRKGLEELGAVALFLVGSRETWQLWAGRDGQIQALERSL